MPSMPHGIHLITCGYSTSKCWACHGHLIKGSTIAYNPRGSYGEKVQHVRCVYRQPDELAMLRDYHDSEQDRERAQLKATDPEAVLIAVRKASLAKHTHWLLGRARTLEGREQIRKILGGPLLHVLAMDSDADAEADRKRPKLTL